MQDEGVIYIAGHPLLNIYITPRVYPFLRT